MVANSIFGRIHRYQLLTALGFTPMRSFQIDDRRTAATSCGLMRPQKLSAHNPMEPCSIGALVGEPMLGFDNPSHLELHHSQSLLASIA